MPSMEKIIFASNKTLLEWLTENLMDFLDHQGQDWPASSLDLNPLD
jgi:hypothetical protein